MSDTSSGQAPQAEATHAQAHEHVHGPGCSHGHHHAHAPAPYVREMPKVGRNDPCPCGSLKKFKKCCAAGA